MSNPSGGAEVPAPSAGQGEAQPSGGESGARSKMFSEEEVERKLRGPGKRIAELESALAKIEADAKAREEAALAEQGKFKEVAEIKAAAEKQARDENKTLKERLAAFEAAQQVRLDEIAASNKERVKALPEATRKDLPKGLDPEALAGVLTTIEKLLPTAQGNGRFAGGNRPPAPTTPEMSLEEGNRRMAAAQLNPLANLQMGRRMPGVSR
jgi:hypothetical protein